MKNVLIIGIAVFIAVIGCRRKTPRGVSEAEMIDSVHRTYIVLNDSVESNWEIMISDDDEKHRYMKRLLLEISYTNLYDKADFDSLTAKIDALRALRYDRSTLHDSDRIDRYDSATFMVTSQVIQAALDHPRYDDFPLMEELIDDINFKNDMILIHRIHYDGFAMELNQYILENRTWLEKAPGNLDLAERPLFRLPG
jgi:hypothetical protein